MSGDGSRPRGLVQLDLGPCRRRAVRGFGRPASGGMGGAAPSPPPHMRGGSGGGAGVPHARQRAPRRLGEGGGGDGKALAAAGAQSRPPAPRIDSPRVLREKKCKRRAARRSPRHRDRATRARVAPKTRRMHANKNDTANDADEPVGDHPAAVHVCPTPSARSRIPLPDPYPQAMPFEKTNNAIAWRGALLHPLPGVEGATVTLPRASRPPGGARRRADGAPSDGGAGGAA